MPANFSGKWKTCKTEGWGELLAKFGVPVDKFPADIVVTEDITQNGDKISIKSSNNKNADVKETTINVGDNFKNMIMSGVELEFTTAWEGNRLFMKQVGGDAESTREFDGAHMVVVVKHAGITAKTTYDKQ